MSDGSEPNLLQLAARGDRDALAVFRDELLIEAENEETPFRRADLLAQAEMFARLAAAHGCPSDRVCLAGLMIWRGHEARVEGDERLADIFSNDGYALADYVLALNDRELTGPLAYAISALADRGDEQAAIALETLVENLTPADAVAVTRQARVLDEKVTV